MRLREATESFIMSREAKNYSSKTVEWYEVMLMKFKNYLKDNDTDLFLEFRNKMLVISLDR